MKEIREMGNERTPARLKKHSPQRTCIGCRRAFPKEAVVRIVAAPAGPVLDYREKLPGRAAYVCPRLECIETALTRENLSRALRTKVNPPGKQEFITMLVENITAKIRSLAAMTAKAGKLAAGYSAVQDALDKGRVELLLYAKDIAEGTRGKLSIPGGRAIREDTVLTREEYGKLLSRELVGVIAIEDKGLADALWKEMQRLKSLIINNQ